jgi:hypothetical protein
VFAIDPLDVDLPHVRSLVVVRKTSSASACPEEHTTACYLSSRLPGPAAEFARFIRGHWGGCEIRNHWVRDALWAEDKTRSKNWNLNANLAILRAGLIALRARAASDLSWPVIFERAAHKPSFPFNLVTKPASK